LFVVTLERVRDDQTESELVKHGPDQCYIKGPFKGRSEQRMVVYTQYFIATDIPFVRDFQGTLTNSSGMPHYDVCK